MKSCEGCRANWCSCGALAHEKQARCLADTRDIEAFVEKYQEWSWSSPRYSREFVATVLGDALSASGAYWYTSNLPGGHA
jgi:hypothetical protein